MHPHRSRSLYRIGGAALACALVAFSATSTFAQTGSKLGPHHILTYTGPAATINAAGPAVIKVLNADGTMMTAIQDAKNANPSCVSVVRIYTTTAYNFGQDPEWAAQDFWNNVLSGPLNALSPSQKALVDYVEGPNEPSYASVSECVWHSDFWLELAPLIANAGFKPCAMSIAVGNPGGDTQEIHDKMDALAPALNLCKSLGGAWSYHAYTIPYTTDINQEIYYSLRYRQYYDYFATAHPNLVDLPLLLTEGGVDLGGGPDTDGWQARGTQQDFENWLTWFDDRMREDPYVIGCTLFQTGSGGWSSFNIDPIAGWLANHINTTPSGPPSAPLGLVATPGDAQVSLSWTASSGASHYDVKRSTTSGGGYSVIADNITATSYLDSGVTNGTTYYYVVSAGNAQGESGNSSQVSATPEEGSSSGNLITNGDFANGLTGWSAWTERGSLNQTVTGGQLSMASTNHNGGMYQQFSTGGIGKTVDISGWWASNPTVANYQWAEVLVINGTRQPVNGQDINAGQSDVEMIYKNDTWATPGGWSGNMDVTSPVANNGSFTAADTVATIILKSGNLQGLNSGLRIDDIVVTSSGTANQPPTAVASANPTSGTAPLQVGFNGSSSSDPDQDPLTYDWDWDDGTSHGSGATPSHTFQNPGTYDVVLTVNDGNGGQDTDTVTIQVSSSGPTVAEDFNSMPSWSDTFNAGWGGAATWGIVGGGQSGNALEAYRSNQGSSVRVKVYNLSANTNYTISVYIKQGSFGGAYWTETAYRLGSHSASSFDSSPGSWTLIKKFDNAGTNGNGNVWTQYSKTFNSGANTQITVGYKVGSSGGAGPTVRWDTLRVEQN
jgi:PKD repeat protein